MDETNIAKHKRTIKNLVINALLSSLTIYVNISVSKSQLKNSHLTCAMGDVRWYILWKLSDFIWTIEFTENKNIPMMCLFH